MLVNFIRIWYQNDFESYGIFDSSAFNLVSKRFKLLDFVEGFPFFL